MSLKDAMFQQIENVIENFVVPVGYPADRIFTRLKTDLLEMVLDRLASSNTANPRGGVRGAIPDKRWY